MLEVEREPEGRIERAEQQLDDPVVARVLERDAHRPEPVAERADARLEDVEAARAVAGQLRCELEAVGHLPGPALELFLARQPVAGRVQLDGREALRIEAEEVGRVQAGGVEPGPPARIAPSTGSD